MAYSLKDINFRTVSDPKALIEECEEQYRQKVEKTAELIIAKQRNGPIGTVHVEWQAEFARYTNKPDTLVAQYAE